MMISVVGSGKFPSRDLSKELTDLYSNEEKGLFEFKTRLTLFHETLNRRNEELESKTYPGQEVLNEETEKLNEEISRYELCLPRIFELRTRFERDLSKIARVKFTPEQIQDFSLLSLDLGDQAKILNTEHEKNVSSLQILLQRITEVYNEAQLKLEKIRKHTMLQFQQRIEDIKKGITEPSAFRGVINRVARYTPPFISSFLSNMPPSAPPLLTLSSQLRSSRSPSPNTASSSAPPSSVNFLQPPPSTLSELLSTPSTRSSSAESISVGSSASSSSAPLLSVGLPALPLSSASQLTSTAFVSESSSASISTSLGASSSSSDSSTAAESKFPFQSGSASSSSLGTHSSAKSKKKHKQ